MAATANPLLNARLRNQFLIDTKRRKPAQVVSWLGAMQAQEYFSAKWAIGLRSPGCLDADIDHAFNDGLILRTHVLRPTWHFVTPEDIRWMLALSAPRIHAASAYYYRQAGLDGKTFAKSASTIHRALEGGQTLTRAELAVHLKRARIPADGLKLAYLVMHAELEAVICSGPRRGKQFTYALLDERAPKAKDVSRDEAPAELAKRYFASHGPATVRDFAWWSGMTLTDAKKAVESVKPVLESSTVDGLQQWSARSSAGGSARAGAAFLLPNYDEYLIAYKDRAPFIDATRSANLVARANGAFANHLVIDGRLAGSWSRTCSATQVSIEVAPYKPLTAAQSRAVTNVAECYGEFLGLRPTVTMV